MYKIVLTGGPCGGKTTILSYLQKELTNIGYQVIVVPEGATELILGGISPQNTSMETFQSFVIDLQIAQERIFEQAISCFPTDKLVLLYDRGILDIGGFVGEDYLKTLLKSRDMCIKDVCARYDLVIHLVSSAIGAQQSYMWSESEENNNIARSETPTEAADRDMKIREIWSCHPNRVIIDNCADFSEKMRQTLMSIIKHLQSRKSA